jgi:Skp family chaperone for outer membrane proteins
LLLAALLGTPAWAQTRIGTVDMGRLFDNYDKTKAARTQLEERKAELARDYNGMVEELRKLKDDYQAALTNSNRQAGSDEERDQRKKLADDKLKQVKKAEERLVDYERTAQSTLRDQYDRVSNKVVEEIRAVLDARAKASGYPLVLDVSALGASGIPVVIFHTTGEDDLTQGTLEQLNAAATPDSRKAPEKESGGRQKP